MCGSARRAAAGPARSRRLRFGAGLALIAALAPAGCWETRSADGPRLLDWPGRNQQPVVLDQALVLQFDRALDPDLRRSSFALYAEGSEQESAIDFEVVGSYLRLKPYLPLSPRLDDGSLRPGTDYRLVLHGVPRLAAIVARDATVLQGSRELRFRTLSATDPGLFAGGGGASFLRLQLAEGLAGLQVQAPAGEPIQIPASHPIHPASLQPARLVRWQPAAGEAETYVPLRLLRNGPDDAVLAADPPRWEGWARLELPAGLEGTGGQPLLPSHRILHVQIVR